MRHVLWAGLGVVLLGAAAGQVRAGGDAAEMKQILARAIKAAGGEAKVAKLRAMGWKGTAAFTVGDQQLSLKHDVSAQGWDQYRLDLEIQVNGNGRPILLVLNGDKIWVSVDGKARDISKDREANFVRGFLYALRLPQMLPAVGRDKEAKLSHLGELKVGDCDAVGLSISRKGRPDVSLFFDKKNGLPVKSATRLKTPDRQEKDFEFLFTDYKDFDGLKHFTKITVRVDGQDYVTELSEVQVHDELDSSLFGRP
jgi:hypothetical protein